MFEHNERISFRTVYNANAILCRLRTNEKLVIGELTIADKRRCFNFPYAHRSATLHHDDTISAVVTDSN
jgi:hypothetical protein